MTTKHITSEEVCALPAGWVLDLLAATEVLPGLSTIAPPT